MIADPRLDAGGFRPPADDGVGVLLEEGIGGELAGLAAGAAEEMAVDVIGDAGGTDIVVQILIETMTTGNVVLLAAFLMQAHPTPARHWSLCFTFGIAGYGCPKVPGQLVIIMPFVSVALLRYGFAAFLIEIARPDTT